MRQMTFTIATAALLALVGALLGLGCDRNTQATLSETSEAPINAARRAEALEAGTSRTRNENPRVGPAQPNARPDSGLTEAGTSP